MFETNLAVIGNVLTAPEWRRTSTDNTLVANFRVASTSRRFDRETGNGWASEVKVIDSLGPAGIPPNSANAGGMPAPPGGRRSVIQKQQ